MIDVSAHQGIIDWGAVRADDIDQAYLKATEGRDFVDERFRANVDGARRAGVTTGAYHFFTLCSRGREQAEHFRRTMGTTGGPAATNGLAPAVDLELAGNCAARPPSDVVDRELAAFLTDVERATGTRVVLYLGEDWESRYGMPEDVSRPLWIRRLIVRPNGDADRESLRRSGSWQIWQATGYAHVDGIDGDVDLNVAAPGVVPR